MRGNCANNSPLATTLSTNACFKGQINDPRVFIALKTLAICSADDPAIQTEVILASRKQKKTFQTNSVMRPIVHLKKISFELYFLLLSPCLELKLGYGDLDYDKKLSFHHYLDQLIPLVGNQPTVTLYTLCVLEVRFITCDHPFFGNC